MFGSLIRFSNSKVVEINKRFVAMKRFTNIIKPAEDTRSYRGLKLQNGLSALLISDPETDNSAAALSVHVGSFLDPKELQGLAHFLEHMLFMGTKKYPSENEYSKFLSQHAGNSNAYTSDVCTTYYFDVSPDHLQPALDRFAQFFIDPLMLADSVNREMEAVNSEYQKNKENDSWRECQIQKLLGDPDHDFSKFNIGNLETLRDIPQSKKIDIREELFKFHEKWYSANNMYLAVLGKESLDELENIVAPMFTPIVNRNLQCRSWDHPYKQEHLMKQASIVPIKDKRTMAINFVYPDETKYYKSTPGHYLSHLIGHEGRGSLLSELKELGFVSGLASWTDSTDGFGSFNVSLELTEEGLKKTDEIAKHFFQYVNLLKEKEPQEYIFKELKELAFIKFNFMEKQNPVDAVEKYSSKMHYFPIEEIISANILIEEFRPDLIKEMLNYLRPDNCGITLTSKAFEGKTDKVEHYFGVKYKVEPFSESLINKIKNAGLNPKYFLPAPNELIPTDFKLVSDKKDESKSKNPARIFKNELLHVWFLQDWIYLKPKVFYGIRMANPINLKSPHASNCHNLFSMLFTDALTEYLYDAKLAGLVFDISQNEVGFTLQFFGYNHKMSCFLKRVLERLVSYKIDPHRFAIQKERFQRWLKNFKTHPLYKLVNYYNGLIIYENTFTYEERIEVLDQLTLDAVQQFWTEFLKNMHVDMLLYGNIDRPQADEMTKMFLEQFLHKCQTNPLSNDLPRTLREIQLPPCSSHLYETVNEVQTMKAILNYYQVGNDFSDRCILYVIDQILNEPFFDYLRTKEQLGYIVFSKYHQNFGVHGMQFVIQSQFGAKYLDRRIEAFIAWAEKYIEDLTEQEFEKEKSSLITKLLKKKKRLYHFATQLHYEIERQEFDFERKERLVAGIRNVTKKDVVQLFHRHFNREGPVRQKICIRINRDKPEENKQEPTDEAKIGIIPEVNIKDPVLVSDHKSFKNALKFYPRAVAKISD